MGRISFILHEFDIEVFKAIPHCALATHLLIPHHKRGKICSAKLSPNEVFHGKTFVVPYMFKTLQQHHHMKLVYIMNIHHKTFAVLLKTMKNAKV